MSKVITVVGSTGSGKTTFVKENFMNNKKVLYFDLYNYEYAALPEVSDWTNFEGAVKYSGEGQKNMKEKVTYFFAMFPRLVNTTVIIEDATIFLRGGIADEDIMDLLISRRHRNNQIIFLFHSLQRIPPFIYEQTNYLVLKKTGDEELAIKRKFSSQKLVALMKHVQGHPDKYYTGFLKLN